MPWPDTCSWNASPDPRPIRSRMPTLALRSTLRAPTCPASNCLWVDADGVPVELELEGAAVAEDGDAAVAHHLGREQTLAGHRTAHRLAYAALGDHLDAGLEVGVVGEQPVGLDRERVAGEVDDRDVQAAEAVEHRAGALGCHHRVRLARHRPSDQAADALTLPGDRAEGDLALVPEHGATPGQDLLPRRDLGPDYLAVHLLEGHVSAPTAPPAGCRRCPGPRTAG